MDDDPVADEGDLALPDDARGQQVKVVGLVTHNHSVSRVVAALQKNYEIEVHKLAMEKGTNLTAAVSSLVVHKRFWCSNYVS